jgi:hypothetical protein
MGFLKHSKGDIQTLEADNTQTLNWYIDAAFAVHPGMKNHTGVTFTLGKGAIVANSTSSFPDMASNQADYASSVGFVGVEHGNFFGSIGIKVVFRTLSDDIDGQVLLDLRIYLFWKSSHPQGVGIGGRKKGTTGSPRGCEYTGTDWVGKR